MTPKIDVDSLLYFRDRKNLFLRDHPHSPLTLHQQRTFTGLSYYDPNPDLILEVEVNAFEEQEQILMQTNRDELSPFFRYGTFDVTVGDASATLTIYRSPDGYFFLPFVDGGAGTETYSAGRYLDLEKEPDGTFTDLEKEPAGTFIVDFNLAYNPFCAYNDKLVCPITPPENHIGLKIAAGEKLPTGEWVIKA
jgi:uncharacterized protein